MDTWERIQVPLLRCAQFADLDDILELEIAEFGALSYPYFVLRQLFDVHGSHWLVAESDDSVCGYVLITPTAERSAWFVGLAVSRQCRGRGYGRLLLGAALDQCRHTGIDQVFITVRPGNRSAYNLYRAAGFVRVDHEQRYFGVGEPRDLLVRKLAH